MRRLRYGTRLTIAYTAIFAVALLAFSGVATGVVRWSLGLSAAARLQATTNALQNIPDVRHEKIVLDPDDRRQFLGLLSKNRVDGAAVDDDGTIIVSNLAAAPRNALVAAGRSGPTGGAVRSAEGLDYASQPIVDRRGRVMGSVIAWLPHAASDDVVRITFVSLLVTALAIIAIAAVAGGALIRRMLSPIVDLNAMISAIEASDLSERVAWEGPDDELGRLCFTFDRLLDRLQSAFERERRFTANASHELRTPLAVMRAEIELTLSRRRDEPAYRATLQRLQLETNRLEALVESLLLTARSDAGFSTMTLTRLDEIAERAVNRLAVMGEERDVAIRVAGGDAWAKIEPVLIESALVAVLENALRYTTPGGSIRVGTDTREGLARITVADGGPGFSPEALHHATQRFWRDDASRSSAGMGLGLAIVAAVAERHGGTIVLRNDGGGIVELRLPAVAEPQEWAKSGAIGSTLASSA